MNARFAHHIVDEGHTIHDRTERGNDLAERLAALAARPKIPDRLEPGTEAVLEGLDVLSEGGGLAVLLDQLRFEVEQVDVAGSAGHEELNDPFGFGCVVQSSIGPSSRNVGEGAISPEERGEGYASEPTPGVPEKIAAIDGLPPN
jgi:hypothetical protein